MSEYNLSFFDMMNEIFDSGCEYVKENCDSSYRFCAVDGVVVLKHYDNENGNTVISDLKITPCNLKAKYKKFSNFFKKDLRSGMVVRLGIGQYYYVSQSPCNNELILFSFNAYNDFLFINLNEYKDDLSHKKWSQLNISKVYEFKYDGLLGMCLSTRNREEMRSFIACNKEKIVTYCIEN